MTKPTATQFENALADLVEIYLLDGLPPTEVNAVLRARADDDYSQFLTDAVPAGQSSAPMEREEREKLAKFIAASPKMHSNPDRFHLGYATASDRDRIVSALRSARFDGEAALAEWEGKHGQTMGGNQ